MAGWRVAISDQKAKMLIEMYGIVSRFVVLALCQRTGKVTDFIGFMGFRTQLVRLRWKPQLSSESRPQLLLLLISLTSLCFLWALNFSIAYYVPRVCVFYRDAHGTRFDITSHASEYSGTMSLLQLRTYQVLLPCRTLSKQLLNFPDT